MERRLARLLLTQKSLTSDDITEAGAKAVDGWHSPNGEQNSIGAHFRMWASNGWIVKTGESVQSRAKHRKGGRIQVWEPTDRGRDWAKRFYKNYII